MASISPNVRLLNEMKSLKEQLRHLILTRGEVSYGELVTFAMEEGYKPDNMTRRMRELCAEENITPLTKKSKRNTDYIYAYKVGAAKKEQKRIVIENGRAILYLNQ